MLQDHDAVMRGGSSSVAGPAGNEEVASGLWEGGAPSPPPTLTHSGCWRPQTGAVPNPHNHTSLDWSGLNHQYICVWSFSQLI